MSYDNGTMRRKPQLSDSIEKLDKMIGDLSTAIPAAVGESVREALGPAFAASFADAVKRAVIEALKELAPATGAAPVSVAVPVPPEPIPQARPTSGVWTKVKAVLGRMRRWTARTVAPVVGHIVVGWAVAKLIGGATIRSRVAALVTALTGTAAGLLGFVAGPIGAAVLLALVSGVVTAAAVWAAPAIRLFAALRDD